MEVLILRFNPWVGKVPWRREWQPTPVFLPHPPPYQTITNQPSVSVSVTILDFSYEQNHIIIYGKTTILTGHTDNFFF